MRRMGVFTLQDMSSFDSIQQSNIMRTFFPNPMITPPINNVNFSSLQVTFQNDTSACFWLPAFSWTLHSWHPHDLASWLFTRIYSVVKKTSFFHALRLKLGPCSTLQVAFVLEEVPKATELNFVAVKWYAGSRPPIVSQNTRDRV